MQHRHLWYIIIESDRKIIAQQLIQSILRHKRKNTWWYLCLRQTWEHSVKTFSTTQERNLTWIDVKQLDVSGIKRFWFCIITWLQFYKSPSIIIITVVIHISVLALVQPWGMAVNNSHVWTDHEFVMRYDMPHIIGTHVCCALHNKTVCLFYEAYCTKEQKILPAIQ